MEPPLFLFWNFVMLLNALFALNAEFGTLTSLSWKSPILGRAAIHDPLGLYGDGTGSGNLGNFFALTSTASG